MSGTAAARAHGAITVLNATATGHGCALAVEGGVEATWTWDDGDGLVWEPRDVDGRVAQAVYALLRRRFDTPAGARAVTRTATPPSRGLKTSSSAAAALLQAGARALGEDLQGEALCTLGAEACLAAGVSLTGAFDDQVATVLGGCHITDNRGGRILASIPVPAWHVAVWVAERRIGKDEVAALDATLARRGAEAAEERAWRGDVPGAMTLNGETFHGLYRDAALPVTDRPAKVALAAGALGAGLSGTGPAVAALFDAPTELAAVEGGTWRWTRAVAA